MFSLWKRRLLSCRFFESGFPIFVGFWMVFGVGVILSSSYFIIYIYIEPCALCVIAAHRQNLESIPPPPPTPHPLMWRCNVEKYFCTARFCPVSGGGKNDSMRPPAINSVAGDGEFMGIRGSYFFRRVYRVWAVMKMIRHLDMCAISNIL